MAQRLGTALARAARGFVPFIYPCQRWDQLLFLRVIPGKTGPPNVGDSALGALHRGEASGVIRERKTHVVCVAGAVAH